MLAHFLLLPMAAALSLPVAADELSVARQALRDGLWDVARAHAEKAGDVAEARLVRLESWAAEGKWNAISNALERWTADAGDAFDYYRAVVRGDSAEAARLLKAGGSPDGVAYAKLYEADRLAGAGKGEKASDLWREVCAGSNVSARAFAIAASNLKDPDLLRQALERTTTQSERRPIALRLGMALLRDSKTASEGVKIVRAVVRDAPDTPEARDAMLAAAAAERAAAHWQEAISIYDEAKETWPETAQRASVQEGLGWAFAGLSRPKEALAAFAAAERLSTNDEARAMAALKQGDALTTLGKLDAAMECYRRAVVAYPETAVADQVGKALKVRELEAKGKELYRTYRFGDALNAFRQVRAEDPSRRSRMLFFEVLCLFGNGEDAEAERMAEKLRADCPDPRVRSDVCLWLAKFRYNRREWAAARQLFLEAANTEGWPPSRAAEALLWAARAAFADGNLSAVIQTTTQMVERFPSEPAHLGALILQGEALVELARFNEAILVLDRVAAAPDTTPSDRERARLLRADVLFAMGADNSAHYTAALEAYRAILFGEELTPGRRIVVSFKIARTLEKLNRPDEAIDQYYTQVVLAYRRERKNHLHLEDEARAVFSKAAFRLADEFENRGKDRQAAAVLDLVATSDSPAAEAAKKRIRRLTAKGVVP